MRRVWVCPRCKRQEKTPVDAVSLQCRCESPEVWMDPIDPPRRPMTIPKPVSSEVMAADDLVESEPGEAVSESIVVTAVIEETQSLAVEIEEPSDNAPPEPADDRVLQSEEASAAETDAISSAPAIGENTGSGTGDAAPQDNKRKTRRKRNRGRRRKKSGGS